MNRVQVLIPEDLQARSKNFAQSKGMSFSELVRWGLSLALKTENESLGQKRAKLRHLIGSFSSEIEDPDAALHHNDIYLL